MSDINRKKIENADFANLDDAAADASSDSFPRIHATSAAMAAVYMFCMAK